MGNLTEKNVTVSRVIRAAYDVFDEMGPGLSERNYHRGLEFELEILGIPYVSGYRCEAFYKGRSCDPYYVDLFVQDMNKQGVLVVELKVCRQIEPSHLAQTYNYMHMTGVKDGLVINFGGNSLGRLGVNVRRLFLPGGGG